MKNMIKYDFNTITLEDNVYFINDIKGKCYKVNEVNGYVYTMENEEYILIDVMDGIDYSKFIYEINTSPF